MAAMKTYEEETRGNIHRVLFAGAVLAPSIVMAIGAQKLADYTLIPRQIGWTKQNIAFLQGEQAKGTTAFLQPQYDRDHVMTSVKKDLVTTLLQEQKDQLTKWQAPDAHASNNLSLSTLGIGVLLLSCAFAGLSKKAAAFLDNKTDRIYNLMHGTQKTAPTPSISN